MKIPHDYVAAILNKDIVINCASKDKEKSLKKIGARRKLFERNKWHLKCQTDNKLELAALLKRLRDLGFCFAGAPGGWPPASVFGLLREQGYVNGQITEIMWRGQGKVVKREM